MYLLDLLLLKKLIGFRAYYEDYVADQYGVTFTYTDELKDAASERVGYETVKI